jgi:hypothetical protein
MKMNSTFEWHQNRDAYKKNKGAVFSGFNVLCGLVLLLSSNIEPALL